MEAFVESIPKHQTNATGEYLAYLAYLARYVLGTLGNANASREFETLGTADAWLAVPSDLSGLYSSPVFCVYWPPVLVVMIGKTRVKTQHDDDDCPQNDQ
jgi:hypothetical protein